MMGNIKFKKGDQIEYYMNGKWHKGTFKKDVHYLNGCTVNIEGNDLVFCSHENIRPVSQELKFKMDVDRGTEVEFSTKDGWRTGVILYYYRARNNVLHCTIRDKYNENWHIKEPHKNIVKVEPDNNNPNVSFKAKNK